MKPQVTNKQIPTPFTGKTMKEDICYFLFILLLLFSSHGLAFILKDFHVL